MVRSWKHANLKFTTPALLDIDWDVLKKLLSNSSVEDVSNFTSEDEPPFVPPNARQRLHNISSRLFKSTIVAKSTEDGGIQYYFSSISEAEPVLPVIGHGQTMVKAREECAQKILDSPDFLEYGKKHLASVQFEKMVLFHFFHFQLTIVLERNAAKSRERRKSETSSNCN